LRREKLAERQRSEVKFRMLVEAAACMVIILREDDSIAYFSPHSELLTAYAEPEALVKQFLPLFVPAWARALARRLQGESSMRIAAEFLLATRPRAPSSS
jgi:PAS domain-containing protein